MVQPESRDLHRNHFLDVNITKNIKVTTLLPDLPKQQPSSKIKKRKHFLLLIATVGLLPLASILVLINTHLNDTLADSLLGAPSLNLTQSTATNRNQIQRL